MQIKKLRGKGGDWIISNQGMERKDNSIVRRDRRKRREERTEREASRLEQSRWEELREENQHLGSERHHRTLMVNLCFHRRGERNWNLLPVIFHLVSLCSDILHLLQQLFAACADRWLLLFDIHSSGLLSLTLSSSFRGKANFRPGIDYIGFWWRQRRLVTF